MQAEVTLGFDATEAFLGQAQFNAFGLGDRYSLRVQLSETTTKKTSWTMTNNYNV